MFPKQEKYCSQNLFLGFSEPKNVFMRNFVTKVVDFLEVINGYPVFYNYLS